MQNSEETPTDRQDIQVRPQSALETEAGQKVLYTETKLILSMEESSDKDDDDEDNKRIRDQRERDKNMLKGKSLIERKRLLNELEAQK